MKSRIERIGVVVAMEKELLPFLKGKEYELRKINAYDVYVTSISGKTLYMVKLPTVGEICAAAATQLLITAFDVQLILNFGVVGALTEKGALLSTMLVESVVHYDMDTSVMDNCPVGRYMIFDDVAIPTDKDLIDIALSVQQLPVVRCASADKFVEGREAKSRLHNLFGADICDMESAGIVITAKLNNVKVLMVKAVSDSLCGDGTEYEQNLDKAAQEYVGFVQKLLNKLN